MIIVVASLNSCFFPVTGNPPPSTHTSSCRPPWTGQCQSVQWHSHATPTQPPLMGEQVLDRVQRSGADPAAAIHQAKRPAAAPPSGLREENHLGHLFFFSKSAFVCDCVCTRAAVRQQQAPNANDFEPKNQECSWMMWKNARAKAVHLLVGHYENPRGRQTTAVRRLKILI